MIFDKEDEIIFSVVSSKLLMKYHERKEIK